MIARAKSRLQLSAASNSAGLRIAVFSPSSPADRQRLKAGISLIKDKIPDIRLSLDRKSTSTGNTRLAYLAGHDSYQARLFTELIRDASLDAVWCTRGGYGSSRWLDMVPWGRIEPRGPLLVGFSDVTFVHAALLHVGRPSLHAPMIATIPSNSETSKNAMWTFLANGVLPALRGTSLNGGKARGHLAGGNLTCLSHLIGTPYEPKWQGAILFLEEHNEAAYRIDRTLTHLIAANRLQQVSGIALGSFSGAESKSADLLRLFEDRLRGLDVPIVANLPFGHGPENYPLLSGAEYEIDGEGGILAPAKEKVDIRNLS